MAELSLLKDMFPTYDEEVLRTVLADCNNNAERATDLLLNMESGVNDEMLARQLAQSEYSGGFGNTDYVPTGVQRPGPKSTTVNDFAIPLESIDPNVIKEVLNGVKGGVIPIMLKQLSGMNIPSTSEQIDAGKMGLISVGTEEIKVAEAHVPEENVEIKVEKTQIEITVKDISAKLDPFKWSYEKHSFPKMKDNGTATASIDETEIQAFMGIGMDGYGNPTVTITSCIVKIGKLDMKISGTMASFFYNTVLALFKKTIKNTLEQSLSKLITDSVNNDNTLAFF